jgi:hypothetical protein
MSTHVEHIVSCGEQSDHFAVDVEHTEAEAAPRREVPLQLSKPWLEEREARRRAALTRLQTAALTDEHIADLLVVLELEDQ